VSFTIQGWYPIAYLIYIDAAPDGLSMRCYTNLMDSSFCQAHEQGP
jgi:hypothetical protein